MIFSNDASAIQGFLEDTSNLKFGTTPGVFFPETFEDVAGLLTTAAADGRRYTVAGNGTGTTGGRIPLGDYVIAMHRLNNIGTIERMTGGKGHIRVEGGATLEAVQAKAEEEGWFYPPDPTEKLCFIGSTIANNSSGARSFKYGATRNHVHSIRVALPQGDIVHITRGDRHADLNGCFTLELPLAGTTTFSIPAYRMPETSKHNAGYFSAPGMDLIDLFIGSEGTLGIILEAELLLLPAPEKVIACLVFFDNTDKLLSFVEEAKKGSCGVSPRVVELFDEHSLAFLRPDYPTIPPATRGAIYFEQETTAAAEEIDLEHSLALMEACGAMADDSWAALDRDGMRKLREFRHRLPVLVNEWLSRQQESKISTDMAVPDNRFRELFALYRDACDHEGFTYIIFGHIGNAHLHLNILPKNRDEFLRAKTLYRSLLSAILDMGGTLSAEHGTGKLKAEYLAEMYGDEGIGEMVRVKRALDPYLVLNIGNLIPIGFYQ